MWTCQRTSIEIALNLPERQCIEGASMRPGCQDLKWNLHFERRKPWIFERCALRWTSLQRHKISSWQCFLQKRRQLRKETGTSLQYQFKINIACSVHFDMNPAAYGHYCRARVTYTERRPIKSGHCGVVGKRAGRSLLRRDISTQVLLLQSCKETTHCSRKETFVISISIVKIHLGDTQGQGSFLRIHLHRRDADMWNYLYRCRQRILKRAKVHNDNPPGTRTKLSRGRFHQCSPRTWLGRPIWPIRFSDRVGRRVAQQSSGLMDLQRPPNHTEPIRSLQKVQVTAINNWKWRLTLSHLLSLFLLPRTT